MQTGEAKHSPVLDIYKDVCKDPLAGGILTVVLNYV